MPVPGGVLLTVISLLAGWACLWPLRRVLGWGYHVAAYPVGLLSWPVVATVLSTFSLRFSLVVVLAAYAVSVTLVGVAAAYVGRTSRGSGQAPRPWTFAAWAGLLIGVSAITSLTRWTSAAYDSVFHYEAWGMWLLKTGNVSVEIIGDYGVFIPSIQAADKLLGSGWTAVPYPVLSVHVLAIVLAATYGWARPRLGHPVSSCVAIVTAVSMASVTPYLHHTLYVHSHMITAAYLLLAVWAIQRAYLGAGDDSGPECPGHTSTAWLFVAGLSSAGFALTRTDGIAYVVVPIVVATLLRLETRGSRSSYAVFLALVAAPLMAVYSSAFLDLGLWAGRKLTGMRAATTLSVLAIVALATLAIDSMPRLWGFLSGHRRGLLLAIGMNTIAVIGIAIARPEGFAETGRNMVINLFSTGGYRLLWYFAVGVIAIPVLWRFRWTGARWPAYLLFTIGQFLVVAVLVHGVAHPGRLSPADSFTRVSFHSVPLVFWYMGIVAATLAHALRSTNAPLDPVVRGAREDTLCC